MRLIINGRYTGDLIGSTLNKKGRQVVKFHAFDGFGMPRHVLTNPRVKQIRLSYNNKIYKSSSENWLKHGIPYHKPPYEPQLVLTMQHFNVVDKEQLSLMEV